MQYMFDMKWNFSARSLLRGAATMLLAATIAPPSGAQSAADSAAAIEGTVVSVPSGAGIRHAQVQLFAPKSKATAYSAESDTSGRFSFAAVEPGEYRMVATKEGYDAPKADCGATDFERSGNLTLARGQKVTGMKLQLLAPAAIEGAVYDASGEPRARADMNALKVVANDGKRSFATMAFAETDDRGHYRLFYLPPGQYYVSIGHDFAMEGRGRGNAREDDSDADSKGFLPIFYGDTTDSSAATVIDLKAGEEFSGADITARPVEVLRVQGRIVNGITGEPMKQAATMAQLLDAPIEKFPATSFFDVRRGDGGYTEGNLSPGRYVISAFTTTPIDHHQWAGSREIELTNVSLNGVDIRAYPGEDIHGTVEMADGGKLPGDLRVYLSAEHRSPVRPSVGEVKADGSFLVTDATPGTYQVRVVGLPKDYFVKAARMGSVDVLENGLHIGGGGSGGTLSVTLSAAAPGLEGTVTDADGKSACRGDVVLIPQGARKLRSDAYPTAAIDPSGHFAIRGLLPGEYKAFAWLDAQGVAYRDAAVMQRYEAQGAEVELKEGDKRQIELKLILGESPRP